MVPSVLISLGDSLGSSRYWSNSFVAAAFCELVSVLVFPPKKLLELELEQRQKYERYLRISSSILVPAMLF